MTRLTKREKGIHYRGLKSILAKERNEKGEKGFKSNAQKAAAKQAAKAKAAAAEEAVEEAATAAIEVAAAPAATSAAAAVPSSTSAAATAAGSDASGTPVPLRFVNLINYRKNCFGNTFVQFFSRLKGVSEMLTRLSPISLHPLLGALRQLLITYSTSDGKQRIPTTDFMKQLYNLKDSKGKAKFKRYKEDDPMSVLDVTLELLAAAGATMLPNMCRIRSHRSFDCGCGECESRVVPLEDLFWLPAPITLMDSRFVHIHRRYTALSQVAYYKCDRDSECYRGSTMQTTITSIGDYFIVKLVRETIERRNDYEVEETIQACGNSFQLDSVVFFRDSDRHYTVSMRGYDDESKWFFADDTCEKAELLPHNFRAFSAKKREIEALIYRKTG